MAKDRGKNCLQLSSARPPFPAASLFVGFPPSSTLWAFQSLDPVLVVCHGYSELPVLSPAIPDLLRGNGSLHRGTCTGVALFEARRLERCTARQSTGGHTGFIGIEGVLLSFVRFPNIDFLHIRQHEKGVVLVIAEDVGTRQVKSAHGERWNGSCIQEGIWR